MNAPSRRKFLQTSSLAGLATLGASVSLPTAARAADAAALQMGWLKSVQYAGSFIAEERGYYATRTLRSRSCRAGRTRRSIRC